MDIGFIVLDPSKMSQEQIEQILLFLKELTKEQIKNSPEGG